METIAILYIKMSGKIVCDGNVLPYMQCTLYIQTLKRINDVNPSGKHTLATEKTRKQFFFSVVVAVLPTKWRVREGESGKKCMAFGRKCFSFFFLISRTVEPNTRGWHTQHISMVCCVDTLLRGRPTDSYDNFKKGPVYSFQYARSLFLM